MRRGHAKLAASPELRAPDFRSGLPQDFLQTQRQSLVGAPCEEHEGQGAAAGGVRHLFVEVLRLVEARRRERGVRRSKRVEFFYPQSSQKKSRKHSHRRGAHDHRVGGRAGQGEDAGERVGRVEAGAVDAGEDEAPRSSRGVIEKDHRSRNLRRRGSEKKWPTTVFSLRPSSVRHSLPVCFFFLLASLSLSFSLSSSHSARSRITSLRSRHTNGKANSRRRAEKKDAKRETPHLAVSPFSRFLVLSLSPSSTVAA